MRRHFLPVARTQGAPPRRGAIAIIAMIAILLASAVGAAVLKTSLADRQVVQSQQDRLQADWLAESGLARADARLASDPEYRGETWTIPAGELGDLARGSVVIRVESDAGRPRVRRVTAAAVYRRGESVQSRSTKTVDVEATATEATGN